MLQLRLIVTRILKEMMDSKKKKKVGDDLSVCMMNILPKVSSLPSVLAINLMEIEI